MSKSLILKAIVCDQPNLNEMLKLFNLIKSRTKLLHLATSKLASIYI